MGNKVTIQDIADELGLSRNTVSKALNNTGVLAESTKQLILKKAIEMGYKQFSYTEQLFTANKNEPKNDIALFTSSMPNSSHFGSHLLNTFQEKLSAEGYKLSIYLIRQNELESLILPNSFDSNTTSGIICIELFDKDYCEFISSLATPTLFIDTPANIVNLNLNADILSMENYNSIYQLTTNLINNQKTKLSFVGNIYHCQSFYERWLGYRASLTDAGLPFSMDSSIWECGVYGDFQWLSEQIQLLPVFPDAFICANDFIALDVINALKKLNLTFPKDVLICGFDNSAESKIIDPHLTTVHIPSAQMGYIAADLLLSRIANPKMPYRITHVKTDIIYRESTGLIKSN